MGEGSDFPGFPATRAVIAAHDANNTLKNTQPPPEIRQALVDQDTQGIPIMDMPNVLSSRVGGLRSQQRRMSFIRMSVVGSDPKISPVPEDELICHYNPETVSKTVGSTYNPVLGVAGVRTERFQFWQGNATTWTMKLFFSTWGDEFRSRPGSCRNVGDSITWLEETIRPSKMSYLTERIDGKLEHFEGPRPVFVSLFDKSFVAYIRDASITYQKINPLSGRPIRAEVAINLLEFVSMSL